MSTAAASRTERPAGLDASTVAEAFQLTAQAHPRRPAVRTREGFSITWAEYADKVRRTAASLSGMGLERGQCMGLMLTNRPEFHWFDAAALHLGATPFSVYNTYTAEQVAYQLEDAGASILVTEKAFLDRAQAVPGVERLIVVDDEDGGSVEEHARDDFDFEAAWRAVQPQDTLTLIYTSGTTGPPKGVQLTHSNQIEAVRGFDEIISFPD